MKPLHILLFILILPFAGFAQKHHKKDHNKDHKQVESLFIAHVTSELALSPTESQGFWAVYNEYREENDAFRKKSHADFSNIKTDAEAESILQDLIENDRKRFELKSKLYSDLRDIISPLQILKLKSSEHSFRKKMFDKMKRKKGK